MKMNRTFVNKRQVESLRSIIRKAIIPHIDGDYVLLDIPNYRNIGDTLIWQGELEFLEEINYKCTYSCNPFTFKENKINENSIILLQGGGNFGDVWPVNQRFRNFIIKKYPNNRIIIFPQTIHYKCHDNIKEDADLYNNHKNLIICVRDRPSYELSNKYFHKCLTYMLPDMAFFNDFTKFHKKSLSGKKLIMVREDKELGKSSSVQKIKNDLEEKSEEYDSRDWPGFVKEGTLERRLQAYLIKAEIVASKRLKNIPGIGLLVDDKHGLKSRNYKNNQLLKGIHFINKYDAVYSTRLHGFILSVLLNKEAYIFDNSYGKNKNFFEAWLNDFENVKLIS